ncbi:hypothetical protein LSAT2_026439, partial [Lamellibrachia satsuma]
MSSDMFGLGEPHPNGAEDTVAPGFTSNHTPMEQRTLWLLDSPRTTPQWHRGRCGSWIHFEPHPNGTEDAVAPGFTSNHTPMAQRTLWLLDSPRTTPQWHR